MIAKVLCVTSARSRPCQPVCHYCSSMSACTASLAVFPGPFPHFLPTFSLSYPLEGGDMQYCVCCICSFSYSLPWCVHDLWTFTDECWALRSESVPCISLHTVHVFLHILLLLIRPQRYLCMSTWYLRAHFSHWWTCFTPLQVCSKWRFSYSSTDCASCVLVSLSLLLEWVKRDVNICICILHLTHCHTSYSNIISSLVSGLTLSAYTLTYVVGDCGLDWGREWERPPWAAMRCSFCTLPQYWLVVQREEVEDNVIGPAGFLLYAPVKPPTLACAGLIITEYKNGTCIVQGIP